MVSDLRKRAWRYCVLAVFLVSANASATVMLSIDADPSTPGVQSTRDVQMGDSLDVDVVISGVAPLLPVNVFDLTVTFDDSVLQATGVSSGGYFASFAPVPVLPSEALGATSVRYGEVYVPPTDADLVPSPLGNVLFTITLAVVGQGPASLALGGASDLSGIGLPTAESSFFRFGVPVSFEPQSATLNASTATVPTPSIGLLLLSGMLMLYRARKPQRSRA